MIAGLFFILHLVAVPPVSIHVVPEAESFTLVVRADLQGPAEGPFSGSLSMNGSPTAVPVAGTARTMDGRTELSMTLRYHDVPQDWAERLRADDFDYRIRGKIEHGGTFDWAGTKRWDEVTVEKREDTKANLMKLDSIDMTQFSLFASAGRADISVRNPLSFPLKIASTSYRLMANGRQVGQGSTPGMLLRPEQTTTLRLPIDFDHGELLGAVGSALRSGGQIQGRLVGTLVLRMASGDISVPLDLAGHVSATH